MHSFVNQMYLLSASPQLPLHWLEIYKLPKDAWLIEIEAAATAKQIEEKQRANRTDLVYINILYDYLSYLMLYNYTVIT